jgi:hypothetical protein
MTFDEIKARISLLDKRSGFRLSILHVIEENPAKLILGVSVGQQALGRILKTTDLLDRVIELLDEGQVLEVIYNFDKDKNRKYKMSNWVYL